MSVYFILYFGQNLLKKNFYSVQKHANDNVNDGAREDDYDLVQHLLSDILQTLTYQTLLKFGVSIFLAPKKTNL